MNVSLVGSRRWPQWVWTTVTIVVPLVVLGVRAAR